MSVPITSGPVQASYTHFAEEDVDFFMENGYASSASAKIILQS